MRLSVIRDIGDIEYFNTANKDRRYISMDRPTVRQMITLKVFR